MPNITAFNVSCVCVQETKGYIGTLVGYFKQYTQWVKNSVSPRCMMQGCIWSAGMVSAERLCVGMKAAKCTNYVSKLQMRLAQCLYMFSYAHIQ